MNNLILGIDTISQNPSTSLFDENNLEYKTISFLKTNLYDSGLFVNKLAELAPETNKINKLVFCAGPGAFSPTRAVNIIARILKRLNTNLQIYRINLLYAYYLSLFISPPAPLTGGVLNSEKIIYLKAGMKGFFKEVYNTQNNTITKPVCLVPEMNEEGSLIDEKELNLNLSKNLIDLVLAKQLETYFVKDLDDLQAFYLREVSLTVPKKKLN